MGANYQKLYTYLVAKVDDAIQLIDMVAVKGNSMEMVSTLLRENLVNALQGAEEMYLDDTEPE